MRFLSLIFLCCCCCASENANEQLMICKPATSVFSIQQTNSTNQHGCSSSSRPGKQGPRGIPLSVAIPNVFIMSSFQSPNLKKYCYVVNIF